MDHGQDETKRSKWNEGYKLFFRKHLVWLVLHLKQLFMNTVTSKEVVRSSSLLLQTVLSISMPEGMKRTTNSLDPNCILIKQMKDSENKTWTNVEYRLVGTMGGRILHWRLKDYVELVENYVILHSEQKIYVSIYSNELNGNYGLVEKKLKSWKWYFQLESLHPSLAPPFSHLPL